MSLKAEGWDTFWHVQWPLSVCRDTSEVHFMQHTGTIWQCENCFMWFADEEANAFAAAALRIRQLTTDKHHQN